MKKGINLWCFPGGTSIEECMRIAKDKGFQGVEINLESGGNADDAERLTLETSPADIARLRTLAGSLGLELPSVSTGLLWQYPLSSIDEDLRAKGIEVVRRMIDAAVILGAGAVLVVPGRVDESNSYLSAYSRSMAALKVLAPYAEEKGIDICIENVWNKFLLSPLEMKGFLDAIGSPRVKAYFDVGNVVVNSYPEYWIEILGDRIERVHVKDFKRDVGNITGFVNLLEGDVDWARVMEALRRAGYDGYLTAELSPCRFSPATLATQTTLAMDAMLG